MKPPSEDFLATVQQRRHGGYLGKFSPNYFCAPPNFVVLRNICFKHMIKTNHSPLNMYFYPLKFKIGYGPSSAKRMSAIRIFCFEGHSASRCSISSKSFFYKSPLRGPCKNFGGPRVVNSISARALHKRLFEVLLNEVESVYKGLKIYNNNRWLSRGLVLKRFVECFYEITIFLNDHYISYQKLSDYKWVSKLMFFTDFCEHLNELNVKLWGSGKALDVTFGYIKALEKN